MINKTKNCKTSAECEVVINFCQKRRMLGVQKYSALVQTRPNFAATVGAIGGTLGSHVVSCFHVLRCLHINSLTTFSRGKCNSLILTACHCACLPSPIRSAAQIVCKWPDPFSLFPYRHNICSNRSPREKNQHTQFESAEAGECKRKE